MPRRCAPADTRQASQCTHGDFRSVEESHDNFVKAFSTTLRIMNLSKCWAATDAHSKMEVTRTASSTMPAKPVCLKAVPTMLALPSEAQWLAIFSLYIPIQN